MTIFALALAGILYAMPQGTWQGKGEGIEAKVSFASWNISVDGQLISTFNVSMTSEVMNASCANIPYTFTNEVFDGLEETFVDVLPAQWNFTEFEETYSFNTSVREKLAKFWQDAGCVSSLRTENNITHGTQLSSITLSPSRKEMTMQVFKTFGWCGGVHALVVDLEQGAVQPAADTLEHGISVQVAFFLAAICGIASFIAGLWVLYRRRKVLSGNAEDASQSLELDV